MRRTLGPSAITVHDFSGTSGGVVFRIVRSDARSDPDLLDAFRSHYELRRSARGAELRAAVIHMGISVYREASMARDTATRWPKIGSFVAELHLRPDQGFNYAETGHPLHLTLWGDPVKLRDAIADIQHV